MARIAASTKQDPKFQALVAVLGTEAKAKVAYDRLQPAVDPRVQQLLDAGFTQAEVDIALADKPASAAKAEPEGPTFMELRARLKQHKAAGAIEKGVTVKQAIERGLITAQGDLVTA